MSTPRFILEFIAFTTLMTVCGVLMVVGFAVQGGFE